MNINTMFDQNFFGNMNAGIKKAEKNTQTKADKAEKKEAAKSSQKKTSDTAAADKIKEKSEAELSDKAKELLKKLRSQYGDYDLFVGGSEDDMDTLAASGSKEFTVVFSNDELEKMANDEKYADEKMQMVEGAISMSKKICEENGYNSSEDGQGEKGTINKISITINDDGSMKILAELEKSSDRQRERIEKSKEKRAEEKKEAEKKEQEKAENKSIKRNPYDKNPYEKNVKSSVKRTTLEASSFDELKEKLQNLDWSTIADSRSGDRFDFAI